MIGVMIGWRDRGGISGVRSFVSFFGVAGANTSSFFLSRRRLPLDPSSHSRGIQRERRLTLRLSVGVPAAAAGWDDSSSPPRLPFFGSRPMMSYFGCLSAKRIAKGVRQAGEVFVVKKYVACHNDRLHIRTPKGKQGLEGGRLGTRKCLLSTLSLLLLLLLLDPLSLLALLCLQEEYTSTSLACRGVDRRSTVCIHPSSSQARIPPPSPSARPRGPRGERWRDGSIACLSGV